jgi:hypothetical protein
MSLRKVTLTLDEGWYKALQDVLNPTLRETGEVLRWESVEVLPFEPCKGCDKEDMDEYACFNDKGYCLDCCDCEEHREGDDQGSWRN